MSTIIDRLSADQLDRLLSASYGDIRLFADLMNLNPDSLRGALSRYRTRQRGEGQRDTGEAVERAEVAQGVPENILLLEEADKPLHLAYDRWLYASDWHIPLHSRPMIERLIRVAKRHQVETLIIGGDFFDYDCLSRFPKEQRQAELGKAHQIAGQMLRFLGNVFSEIVILPGNHDRRVARMTGQPWSMDELLGAALGLGNRPTANIITTPNDYVFINSDWVVGHPRFFSSFPAKGVAEVAELAGRNTIGSHNHIQGLVKSKSGHYVAIDPGCMCEAELTPYHVVSDGLSKFPAWQKGFVLIDQGIPTLFDDGRLVDWATYAA